MDFVWAINILAYSLSFGLLLLQFTLDVRVNAAYVFFVNNTFILLEALSIADANWLVTRAACFDLNQLTTQ